MGDQYKKVHKLAKLMTYFIVVLLLLTNTQFNSTLINIVATTVWFFGVNPIAYLLETLLHYTHQHDKF